MHTLKWTDALVLDQAEMDHTHEEFVRLLSAVQNAPDDLVGSTWQALVTHTDGHFGQEDRWMRETRFSTTNCHSTQHSVVLQAMREAILTPAAQRTAHLRYLASELALWFPAHAQTMDAALALHLKRVGYDPITGELALPQALPESEIQGCASAACSGGAQP